ncbi:MAG: cysteine--tRNA ligase [Ruminococcaceae bacterium]|nr:cysteine--tRNA ligase [Oscillospiraceae bacterium]
MQIFNTLTRQKETLVPIEEGKLRIYACGPTVYNFIHIGNARPLCVFDTLRRYLEWRGFDVRFVQNFTDIDDKIIRRANEEGVTYQEIAERYIAEFWTDAKGLGVKEATVHPKATENIDEIIAIIAGLEEKGFAYKAPNGDVYFRTRRFNEYGKLSHQPLDDLESGARIAVGEDKEDPMDFALWKAAKAGEPSWPSPWSDGRPGWHIECSAMARRFLGETIDIHGGGQDLIFPHHENEIAQSECCNGVPFARYWMHNGYINVDNKKMSKSLNNFFTVRDVAKIYGYEAIRFFLISSSYRSPINYSAEIIEQGISALDRLYTCRENLQFAIDNAAAVTGENDAQLLQKVETRRAQFITAMDDDLNTADAIAALFELTKDINVAIATPEKVGKEACEKTLDLFNQLADVLGLLYERKKESLDDEIEALIAARAAARKEKNWAEADRIRDELKARNIVLEDTPQGVKWHRA